MTDLWNITANGATHLNPSKSKINVRTFLNKTGDSFCQSHPNLDNFKASCPNGNPPKPFKNARK